MAPRVTLGLPIFYFIRSGVTPESYFYFVLTYIENLESHQDILGYLVYALYYVSIKQWNMKHIEPTPIGHSYSLILYHYGIKDNYIKPNANWALNPQTEVTL